MSRTKKDKSPLLAIGVRLEKAQKNAGLTNVEIARALDISIQSYIAYKHGKTEMSYEKAMIFAGLTGTSVLDYLTLEGKKALQNEKYESDMAKHRVLLEYLDSIGVHCGINVYETTALPQNLNNVSLCDNSFIESSFIESEFELLSGEIRNAVIEIVLKHIKKHMKKQTIAEICNTLLSGVDDSVRKDPEKVKKLVDDIQDKINEILNL